MDTQTNKEEAMQEYYKFVRVQRPGTDSWMTFELDERIHMSNFTDEFLSLLLPGWEWVCLMSDDTVEKVESPYFMTNILEEM